MTSPATFPVRGAARRGTGSTTTLHGAWALGAAALWLTVVGAAVAVTVAGFAAGFADPAVLRTPQVEQILSALGVPPRVSMAVGLVTPFTIAVGAALLVFVRRSRDWMALLFSATLVCLQAFMSVVIVAVLDGGGFPRLVALAVLHLAGVGLTAVLFLFPDGRPYPGWSRVVGPGIAVVALATSTVPESLALIHPDMPVDTRTNVAILVMSALVVSGSYAQARRYREASSRLERQQTKWVVFPFAAAFGFFLVALLLPQLFVDLSDTWLGWVMIAAIPLGILFPVAVTIAILRFRLYGIDVVIARTLVVAGLGAFVTLAYLGVVVWFGARIGAGSANVALAVVVTAVVAVAFQPLRVRLTRFANRLVFGEQSSPYETLSRFSAHLGETTTTDDTLGEMARLLTAGTTAIAADVLLRLDGELRVAAAAGERHDGGDPYVVEVRHDDEVLGALRLEPEPGDTLTAQDRRLVEDMAAQAGLVLRNARLDARLVDTIGELRASRKRLVAAQDDERRRLERDLHDGAQQQFVAVRMLVGLAKQMTERGDRERAAELLDRIAATTDEGIGALRDLAHGIYPPLLEAEGLAAALAARAAKAPVPVAVDADGLPRYSREVESAAYFCVLEAIQNAVKHAGADRVTVELRDAGGELWLTVRDDGRGFDPATLATGRGVANMRDRLEALHGDVELRSRPGRGTTVVGRLPTG